MPNPYSATILVVKDVLHSRSTESAFPGYRNMGHSFSPETFNLIDDFLRCLSAVVFSGELESALLSMHSPLFFGEWLTLPIFTGTVLVSVKSIAAFGSPFEIFAAVVLLIEIFVITFFLGQRHTVEGHEDEAMNSKVTPFIVGSYPYRKIVLAIRAFVMVQHLTSRSIPHTSKIGHFIESSNRDGNPNFFHVFDLGITYLTPLEVGNEL